MKLHGIHHVSAITRNVQENYNFYTKSLGMQLIKSTIHHEDETARKLYYANRLGSDATSLSFIERKEANETRRGNNSISFVSLLVPSDDSLIFWKKRFEKLSIEHEEITTLADKKALPFTDFEGHKLILIVNEENSNSESEVLLEDNSIIHEKHKIIGIGPSKVTVSNEEQTMIVLRDVLSLQPTNTYSSSLDGENNVTVLSTGGEPPKAEIHLEVSENYLHGETGYSSIHHISFSVKDTEELRRWRDLFERVRMPNSGIVNHLYYQSIYLRDGNGILFELSTEEPGFTVDEEITELGTTLSLPPSLEKQREKTEEKLTPLTIKKPQ